MPHPSHAIPTNLILGFLGVGKTTAILNLLKHKPAGERWAVLVNEFGEVGIDGAMLDMEGAFVREVPGGCMCCVAGLPMQIGLNQLIHRARPDRLLENVQFRDQEAAADILVANKTDLCSEQQLAGFDRWASELAPPRQQVFHTQQGQLSPAWLEGRPDPREVSTPHAHHHHAHKDARPAPDIHEQPWQRVSNQGQGHFSLGWRIRPDHVFDENQLMALAGDEPIVRLKAVVNTPDGWRVINVVDGAFSAFDSEAREMSRIELISARELDADELDRAVRAAVGRSGYGDE